MDESEVIQLDDDNSNLSSSPISLSSSSSYLKSIPGSPVKLWMSPTFRYRDRLGNFTVSFVFIDVLENREGLSTFELEEGEESSDDSCILVKVEQLPKKVKR